MERMAESEIVEHLTDMAEDGDPIDRVAYFSFLTCQFLHSLHRSWGGKAVDEKVLNPWKRDELVRPAPLQSSKNDPLKLAMKVRIRVEQKKAQRQKQHERKQGGKRGD